MKVLIADDDRPLREVFSRTISRWGYETVTAADGLEAVDIMSSEDPPRILLLDIMMPNMNGIEACRRIQMQAQRLAYTIFLTALSSKENFIESMQSGAHDFLAKPVDMTELQSRLEVGRRLVESEDALRKSRIFMEEAARAAGIGMWEYDVRTRKVQADLHIRELIGLPLDVFSIDQWLACLHPDDAEFVRERVEKHHATGRDMCYRARFADGKWHWVQVSGEAIESGADGAPLRVCGCIQDVTEQVEGQHARFAAERHSAIVSLASGVAHNFNNLITGISGNLILLQREPSLSEKGCKLVEKALGASERISDITEMLLRFSGHMQTGNVQKISLATIIEDTVSIMAEEYREEGITLTLDCADAPEILCEVAALSQALYNILENARHAIAESKRKEIAIYSGTQEGQAVIRISDSGCGMTPEELKKVFYPFYSTKGAQAPRGSAQGRFSGLGMGLLTVRSIITRQQGEIEVTSKPGVGTEVTIRLPL